MSENIYFLITSYLSNPFIDVKKTHVIEYIGLIREYVPNSYIIFIDSIPDEDIANLCDIYVCEKRNFNVPHGQADLEKIQIGLKILEGLKAKWFIRSAYDYWMNQTVVNKISEWKLLLDSGKILVSSKWRGENYEPIVKDEMLSMGYGCYTMEGANRIFGFDKLETNSMAEEQLYVRLFNNFNPDEYFLYETCEDMFGGVFFDIFNFSGNHLNTRRLENIQNNK
jgi:hypothetical protein